MKPIISIIVPVYNVENYLERCLDSLIGQTLADIEIICVNDGSKDRSLEILQEYASHDSRIRVFDQANSGVSVARNNALKHVKGEFYMFVDSDDWLDPETCAVAYGHAKQYDADCLMFSYTKEFGDHSIVNHIFDEDCLVWDKKDAKQKFHRRLFGPIGKELAKPQDMDIIVTPFVIQICFVTCCYRPIIRFEIMIKWTVYIYKTLTIIIYFHLIKTILECANLINVNKWNP